MPEFHVVSEYSPAGDQPQAIEKLAEGVAAGLDEQTLLGVTGSGKTYTMAKVIFGKVFMNFGLKLFAVSIGAIIYYIVLQIVLQLGLNTNDLKLITALIVAVFLAIPYWKSKMFRHKVQPQSAKNGGNGHA